MNDWPTSTPQSRGRVAESAAVAYLQENGYRILATNVRFRGAEIDVVAEDGETLVFVEVRARTPGRFGIAEESIGAQKQQRILRAAEVYLQRYEALGSRPSRIDVVAIRLNRQGRPVSVDLIKNAIEQMY